MDILNAVYETMIDDIIKDFNTNEYEEVQEAYRDYLNFSYQNSLKLSNDKEKLKKFFIKLEKQKWENKDKILKQALLLNDENYDELLKLSNMALEYAKLKYRGKENEIPINQEQALDYIEMMNKYSENVRDYNKERTILQLSEATLDFEYAVNLNSNMSLRMGRFR